MTEAMNINYQGILSQVQGQGNSIDSDSETEESESLPCSIKHKEAMDMLDKCLTWLHLLHRTLIINSLHVLAAQKEFYLIKEQLHLLTYFHNKLTL